MHQTAAPNITVAVGTAHELTASELLYEDVTDYYLGGKLTVKNGSMDKYFFDGGYAQAKTNEATLTDNFSLYYYNSDHLGNIREVIDEKGDVVQITNYYPFGTPYSAEDFAMHNPDQQNHKYNGKEFDTTHGLNTYDYGARQYNSLVGRWDRIDPLCEKYYSVSPYAYCANNPVNLIDPDGCDWYFNTNNTLLWNPRVHSQEDLQEGFKYVGVTYNDKKNGIQYRDDGTVMCPNETSGIARMKLQQEVSQSSKNKHGKEQSACLLDDKNGSMLVFPDNWNSGSESNLPAGYKLTSDKLTNIKGRDLVSQRTYTVIQGQGRMHILTQIGILE